MQRNTVHVNIAMCAQISIVVTVDIWNHLWTGDFLECCV